MPWSANAELVAGAFHIAAEVMAEQELDPNDEQARRRYLPEVSRRLLLRTRPMKWSTIVHRCAIAGELSMVLHWGTIGSAIVYSVSIGLTAFFSSSDR